MQIKRELSDRQRKREKESDNGRETNVYTELAYEQAHKHKHRESTDPLRPVCIYSPRWATGG